MFPFRVAVVPLRVDEFADVTQVGSCRFLGHLSLPDGPLTFTGVPPTYLVTLSVTVLFVE